MSFWVIPLLNTARGFIGPRDYVAVNGEILVLWGITREAGATNVDGVLIDKRKSSWVGNYSYSSIVGVFAKYNLIYC